MQIGDLNIVFIFTKYSAWQGVYSKWISKFDLVQIYHYYIYIVLSLWQVFRIHYTLCIFGKWVMIFLIRKGFIGIVFLAEIISKYKCFNFYWTWNGISQTASHFVSGANVFNHGGPVTTRGVMDLQPLSTTVVDPVRCVFVAWRHQKSIVDVVIKSHKDVS